MLKYVTIFPEFPISISQAEHLSAYRRKILHAQLEAHALIPVLNGPSPMLRTVDGHHVNKSFIVAARDYADPRGSKSPQADYERRTQATVYVNLDLATLEDVAVVLSVRRFSDDIDACLERALIAQGPFDFIGGRTDWDTTMKLDNLLDPSVLGVFEKAQLVQSFLAINKHFIKSFQLKRVLAPDEPWERITEPPLFPDLKK